MVEEDDMSIMISSRAELKDTGLVLALLAPGLAWL